MKIVFTGGGTGGHFYPIIAIAESILDIHAKESLLKPRLYYIAPDPFEPRALFENEIEFIPAAAGKVRQYSSIQNFFDIFKIAWGTVKAIFIIFRIYPDVVFSKGGYASVPTLIAARLLRIPIFIHESDSVPGRANQWASKFATRIAISYPDATKYFAEKDRAKIAFTGNPIRKAIMEPAAEGVFEYLELSREVPTILILGGSQGAQPINDIVLEALPMLLEKYQVIHQTGERNYEEVRGTATVALENHPYKNRYKPFAYLNDLATRMSVGASSLIVSRAGSAIFEIAVWKKPSIIIPIKETVTPHQRENAFAYARAGCAVVLEEANLTPHLLSAEIDRLMEHPEVRTAMSTATEKFTHKDAAETIAREIIRIALSHES